MEMVKTTSTDYNNISRSRQIATIRENQVTIILDTGRSFLMINTIDNSQETI